jgi:hypothetical protein
MKWHFSALLFGLGLGALTSCGRSSGRSGKEAPPEKELDEGQKETGEKENPPVDSVKDQPPASAPNSITHEFQVESFSSNKRFEGKSFVDPNHSFIRPHFQILMSFNLENTDHADYDHDLMGYQLDFTPISREEVNGYLAPGMGKRTTTAETLYFKTQQKFSSGKDLVQYSGTEILLKTSSGEVAIGKFKFEVNPESDPWKSFESPILCEGEYASVCTITLTNTMSKGDPIVIGGFATHESHGQVIIKLKDSNKEAVWHY